MTPKQRRFVEEYLIDLNATQAAIRAGYSAKNADKIGPELLGKTRVQAAIQAAMDERSARTEITVDAVLRELAKIGFQDVRGLFTDGGHLMTVSNLPDDIAAAVASVEVVVRPTGERDANDNLIVEYVHKIKTWDKRAALVDIGKHLGMFPTRVDGTIKHEHNVVEQFFAEVRERQGERRFHS